MSGHPSLSEGRCGQRLLQALQKLARDMRELPDEYPDYHEVFSDWQKWLYAGWKAGEPMTAYLAAEYCRLSPDYDLVFDSQDDSLTGGPASAERLYLDAARQGSSLARLWLAYCYEEGRGGLNKKPEAAAGLLLPLSGPVDSLFPRELSFLYDELNELYSLAERALYLFDQYRDPCFSTLNDRSALLYGYMVLLGLRNVPRHERKNALDVYNPNIEWNPAYDALNEKTAGKRRIGKPGAGRRGSFYKTYPVTKQSEHSSLISTNAKKRRLKQRFSLASGSMISSVPHPGQEPPRRPPGLPTARPGFRG